ncbi:hypothetical protein Avbf_01366 [Armadillidium vulgare]|nr:hypothetical protein Avbf_01366 [Armadillidium vulgare]
MVGNLATTPPFETIEVWLDSLCSNCSVESPGLNDILNEIYSYSGRSPSSSEPSTPEILTPDPPRPPLLRTISEGFSISKTSEESFTPGSPPQHPPLFVHSTPQNSNASLVTINHYLHSPINNVGIELDDNCINTSASGNNCINTSASGNNCINTSASGNTSATLSVCSESDQNDSLIECDIQGLAIEMEEEVPEKLSPVTRKKSKSPNPSAVDDFKISVRNIGVDSCKRKSSLLEFTHL